MPDAFDYRHENPQVLGLELVSYEAMKICTQTTARVAEQLSQN